MMKIGLDIRATLPGFRAHFGRGTGRYTAELARCLLGAQHDGIEISGIPPEAMEGRAFQRAFIASLPFGRQTAHTQWILPRELGRLPFDMLHFPYHGDATARCPLPYAVTVLDLIPLRFPEMYKPRRATWRFRLARRLELDAISRAAGIFAISDATKQDVVDLLNIQPERIVVTPLGVDGKFSPRTVNWRQEGRAVRSELAIPADRPILLYYGGIDPRKNVLFLLTLFAALRERLADGAPKPILVLAGAYERDERYPELLRAIAAAGLGDSVALAGFVSEAQLLALLGAADLVLFPSLYEGFGLPLLEAMARGVPVLAGRNSSLREVMGRDEYLCRDNDINDWLEQTAALLVGEDLQQERTRWGLERAKLFTWEKTAERTLEGYRSFLTRRGGPPAKPRSPILEESREV